MPASWPGVLEQILMQSSRSKLWPYPRIAVEFAMAASHRIEALLRHWAEELGQTIADGVAVPLAIPDWTVVVVTQGLQVPYPAMHDEPQ